MYSGDFLSLTFVFLIPSSICLSCYSNKQDPLKGVRVNCPNTGYCSRDLQWSINSFKVTLRCGSPQCNACTRNSTSEKCLITYSDTEYLMCCKDDYCNLDEVPLPRHTEVLLIGWLTELVAFLLVLLMLIAMAVTPYWYVFTLNRRNEAVVARDYDLPIDESLIVPDDAAAALFTDRMGQELDGCLSLEAMQNVVKSTVFDKSFQPPEIAESYPSAVFGDFVTHLAIGFNCAIVDRARGSVFDNILYRMIEQGPGFFRIHPYELVELLEQLNIVLKAESALVELPPNVIVVGDLRGRYCDLMRWLELHGYPPKQRYLFLGGIIDNTYDDSVETFALIAAMKVAMPYDVFILRGVPESVKFVARNRFPKQLCNALALMVERICKQMPVCAVIGHKILAVYSGICKEMTSLEAMKEREAPLNMDLGDIAHGAMFNVPKKNLVGYLDNPDSEGEYFGEDALRDLLKQLNVEMVIRARSAAPSGYFFFARPLMLSIWSSNCKGCLKATTVHVDSEMRLSIHSMAAGMEQSSTCGSQFAVPESEDTQDTSHTALSMPFEFGGKTEPTPDSDVENPNPNESPVSQQFTAKSVSASWSTKPSAKSSEHSTAKLLLPASVTVLSSPEADAQLPTKPSNGAPQRIP